MQPRKSLHCGPQRVHLVVDSKQRDPQVKKKTSLLSFVLGKVKRSCSPACKGLGFLSVTKIKGWPLGKKTVSSLLKHPLTQSPRRRHPAKLCSTRKGVFSLIEQVS